MAPMVKKENKDKLDLKVCGPGGDKGDPEQLDLCCSWSCKVSKANKVKLVVTVKTEKLLKLSRTMILRKKTN